MDSSSGFEDAATRSFVSMAVLYIGLECMSMENSERGDCARSFSRLHFTRAGKFRPNKHFPALAARACQRDLKLAETSGHARAIAPAHGSHRGVHWQLSRPVVRAVL